MTGSAKRYRGYTDGQETVHSGGCKTWTGHPQPGHVPKEGHGSHGERGDAVHELPAHRAWTEAGEHGGRPIVEDQVPSRSRFRPLPRLEHRPGHREGQPKPGEGGGVSPCEREERGSF